MVDETVSDRAEHMLALTIAYDGGPFAGFARQEGLDTVQGRIERAAHTIFRCPCPVVGAGRTDAGVHALGQVVSLAAPREVADLDRLRRSFDALTGEGIVVRRIRRARAGFSARFDATAREYRYRIVSGTVAPLFLERFAWHVAGGLDTVAMEAGAAHLLGEHDFRSFCVTESARDKVTMRRLDTVEMLREEHLGEECDTLRVVGNAFLHSMVRTIAGTLVEVGAGRREPEWVRTALEACERSAAGPSAPAHGLTLHAVTYPDAVWCD